MEFIDPIFWWKKNPLMGIKVNRFQKLVARLFGGCYLGRKQPQGFTAKTKFWLAYDRFVGDYYVYYEHGFHKHSNMITNFMPPPWWFEREIFWKR